MYQIPQFLKYKNLFHAFSEKSDGNMANAINGIVCDFDEVLKNRKKFLEKAGVDVNKTVCMWVTHGDEIIEPPKINIGVSMLNYQKAVKVDGLITNKKGVYMFLLIADCLPIIIYDPIKEAVGLIHAGWKGVDLEIARKAVEKFKSEYNSNPEDVVVGIGPCVKKESFVKNNPSQKNDPRWKDFINKIGDGKYQVDLVGFTKKQLIDAGVQENNIFESRIDTANNDRFFSHTHDVNLHISRQGRFACIVGMNSSSS